MQLFYYLRKIIKINKVACLKTSEPCYKVQYKRMRLIRVLLWLLTFTLLANTSMAQSSVDLRNQRQRLTKEIELLNKTLQKTSSSKTLSIKQVNALLAQIKLREQKISTIASEMTLINREIRKNSQEIKKLEEELHELKKNYASMIQFAFRNKSGYNKLMFLFAAKDFNQAFKRVKYLQQFSESRKNQAKEIESKQQELKTKLAQLERNKKEKASLIQAQETEKKTLSKQKSEKDSAVSNFASQEKEYKQEITKKQQESARLSRAIQAAIKKEIEEERKRAEAARKAAEAVAAAKAKAEADKARAEGRPVEAPKVVEKKEESKSAANILSATPEAAKLSSDFTSNRGRLPWPVENGIVTQNFGQHTYGKNVTVNNDGINIRTNDGQVVRAVFDGVVSSVVQMQGAGYAVIIRHGKYFSVYSNLKSVSVKRFQNVTVKQAIGVAARDPIEGVSEVHFEIWEGTSPLNPTPWLARN